MPQDHLHGLYEAPAWELESETKQVTCKPSLFYKLVVPALWRWHVSVLVSLLYRKNNAGLIFWCYISAGLHLNTCHSLSVSSVSCFFSVIMKLKYWRRGSAVLCPPSSSVMQTLLGEDERTPWMYLKQDRKTLPDLWLLSTSHLSNGKPLNC